MLTVFSSFFRGLGKENGYSHFSRILAEIRIYQQLLQDFSDVQLVLEELNGISPNTVGQLLAILTSHDDRDLLWLQLAAMIDVGQHFITLTYNLEGDDPLVFSTY